MQDKEEHLSELLVALELCAKLHYVEEYKELYQVLEALSTKIPQLRRFPADPRQYRLSTGSHGGYQSPTLSPSVDASYGTPHSEGLMQGRHIPREILDIMPGQRRLADGRKAHDSDCTRETVEAWLGQLPKAYGLSHADKPLEEMPAITAAAMAALRLLYLHQCRLSRMFDLLDFNDNHQLTIYEFDRLYVLLQFASKLISSRALRDDVLIMQINEEKAALSEALYHSEREVGGMERTADPAQYKRNNLDEDKDGIMDASMLVGRWKMRKMYAQLEHEEDAIVTDRIVVHGAAGAASAGLEVGTGHGLTLTLTLTLIGGGSVLHGVGEHLPFCPIRQRDGRGRAGCAGLPHSSAAYNGGAVPCRVPRPGQVPRLAWGPGRGPDAHGECAPLGH